MLLRHPIAWILLSLLLAACGHLTPVVYSEFATIGEEGLITNWGYTFSPVPFDSTEIDSGRFDLLLIVRYSNRCVSKSVILDVESLSINRPEPDSLRVDIPLFDNEGNPFGKGNFGIYETVDTIASGITLSEGYTVFVSSPLPEKETRGITDIGIKLSRTGKTEFNLLKLLQLE